MIVNKTSQWPQVKRFPCSSKSKRLIAVDYKRNFKSSTLPR